MPLNKETKPNNIYVYLYIVITQTLVGLDMWDVSSWDRNLPKYTLDLVS